MLYKLHQETFSNITNYVTRLQKIGTNGHLSLWPMRF